jgi:hypothetical protein
VEVNIFDFGFLARTCLLKKAGSVKCFLERYGGVLFFLHKNVFATKALRDKEKNEVFVFCFTK